MTRGSDPTSPGAGPSLADLLAEHPFDDDAELIATIDRSVSVVEARRGSAETAAALVQIGVRPGHAVVVRLPNGPEFVISMVGIWLAGAVFVPANYRQTAAELAHTVAVTGAAAIIDQGGVRRLEGEERSYPPDVAFVTWTSGTTGAPKPILQTHTGYLEILDRVLGPLRARPSDPSRPPTPNLIPVSLSLNAGIYNVLFGLRAGAAVVLMDRFDCRQYATLVQRFSVRSSVLPPAAMVMLVDEDSVTDLSPLTYVRSITAPLSPLAAQRFTSKFGVMVLNGYGQAEIGEVIGWTARDGREHPEKIGAVGRPHPGVAIKVVSPEGVLLPTGEVGELLVKPPRMAAGYAGGMAEDGLGDRIDAEGFVRTGDCARVDADGFVWIEGRLGDVINRGGNKVFPDEVEEVLRLSPAVTDVAVVGVPDRRLGEVPVAFVVVADGAIADPGRLEQLCREHLVPYKVPVAFEVVSELPRSEVGKLLRRELAAGYRPTPAP